MPHHRGDQPSSTGDPSAELPDRPGAPADSRIAEIAGQFPDMMAVEAPDGSLTYSELLIRADAVADRLRQLGVRPGRLVGLCCGRSAALVIAALGILRSGAAYVALDPDAPVERLQFMLTDSGSAVVVTDARSAPRLAGGRASTVVVDGTGPVDGPALAAATSATGASATGALRAAGPPAQLFPGIAYVVYTSGSTGRPKGVLVEHTGLTHLLDWHITAFDVRETDRVMQVANPAFDAAAWEIWPALAVGACLVIPDDATRRDATALRDFIVDRAIDVGFVPTPLAERLLTLTWPATTRLRFLLTGGDALHIAPPAGLPFALVNNYGLSEATVVSTSAVVPPGAPVPPAIGLAIAGAELSVVDDQLRPVVPGTVGELLVSGPLVARGYLHSPELDADRFPPDSRRPGRRRLRTGDLVRERADGQLEFLGRVDLQIKIRGYRVEPGEIAAALDRHPAVEACHVLATDTDSGTRLTAYLVPALDPDRSASLRPGISDLREYLGRSIPAYMIPAVFAWIPELPVTANGKVDTAALVLAATAPPAAPTQPWAAPVADWQAELDSAVGALVCDLLGLDSVGRDDDFFALGGHSLLGAQLVVRVHEQFGVELRLRDLFDHPTVAGLGSRIAELVVADIDSLGDDEVIALAAGGV
jgi:amino acid adenylation domain-containing protein